MNVAICAYGAGNTRSVQLAFERLGASACVVDDPADVLGAGLAVLPGVGSAGSAMAGLCARGLDDALREREGPILWITINRPASLNALNPLAHREVSAALDTYAGSIELRVAVSRPPRVRGPGRFRP